MPNYMEYICKSFINGTVEDIKPVLNGNINETFKVTINGTNYLLQSINNRVFKDPFALMQNIFKVTEYIKNKNPHDISVCPIKTDNGELLVNCDGKYYRMYNYIDSISYDKIEPNQIHLLYYIGHAYGKFGRLLDGFNQELVDTIPDFHDTAKRYEHFIKTIDTCSAKYLMNSESEVYSLLGQSHMYDMITKLLGTQIPVRVTHNDTKINNVLLNQVTKQDLCVIDLDTVMNGSSLYDFGDGVRSATSTIIEDSRDLNKVDLDLDKYSLFTSGYLEAMAPVLTRQELELLPNAPRIITLELAMRFLTDYLEGSWYFKTNGPKHNLIRARNQIVLASQMAHKEEQMVAITNKIYKKIMS